MKYALKERIGNPSLFCCRKEEMELLINWSQSIPREIVKSRALLDRRKCGKSAIMQRLFNILWEQTGAVIQNKKGVRSLSWLLKLEMYQMC